MITKPSSKRGRIEVRISNEFRQKSVCQFSEWKALRKKKAFMMHLTGMPDKSDLQAF